MKSFKSIGFELELFLTKGQLFQPTNPLTIYNAEAELSRILGFNINAATEGGKGGSLFIHNFGNQTLTTDGTPVEFSCFLDVGGKNWNGSGLHYLIDTHSHWINRIGNSLLKDFKLNDSACFESSHYVKFNNPHAAYASNKTIHNAYTGESFIQDEKEEDKEVTRRTAGLHIHFELNKSRYGNPVTEKSITDKIIKSFDDIYYNNYFSSTFQSIGYERRDALTPKGLYRIKNQANGVITLEYRQPTTKMFFNKSIYGFLVAADEAVSKILR